MTRKKGQGTIPFSYTVNKCVLFRVSVNHLVSRKKRQRIIWKRCVIWHSNALFLLAFIFNSPRSTSKHCFKYYYTQHNNILTDKVILVLCVSTVPLFTVGCVHNQKREGKKKEQHTKNTHRNIGSVLRSLIVVVLFLLKRWDIQPYVIIIAKTVFKSNCKREIHSLITCGAAYGKISAVILILRCVCTIKCDKHVVWSWILYYLLFLRKQCTKNNVSNLQNNKQKNSSLPPIQFNFCVMNPITIVDSYYNFLLFLLLLSIRLSRLIDSLCVWVYREMVRFHCKWKIVSKKEFGMDR